MSVTAVRVWELISETGTSTQCHVQRCGEERHEVTITHNGSLAAVEVHASEFQAHARARELNRALLARGWSEPRHRTSRED
jgi:PHD/YefM family antitoxin component YafN of YafNO toxin-antitoxin module